MDIVHWGSTLNSATPRPSVLSEQEQSDLLDQPDPFYAVEHRNLAIFMVLLNCGLRITELVSLGWDDLDEANRTLRINSDTEDRKRCLPVSDKLFHVLSGWRDRQFTEWTKRHAIIENEEYPQSIFSKLKQSTNISEQYVRNLLLQETERAGIQRLLHPDVLRHTFATELYEKTGDIHRVHRALGNQDVFRTVHETRIPKKKLHQVRRKLRRTKEQSAEMNNPFGSSRQEE